jgi:type 1 fimbria pilin
MIHRRTYVSCDQSVVNRRVRSDSLTAMEIAMSGFAARSVCVSRSNFHRIGGLLLLLLLALVSTCAKANCTFDKSGDSTATISFTTSASITVPFTFTPNFVLFTTGITNPSASNSATCTANTAYGVHDISGTTPASNVAIYPTSVAGIGYTLIHDSIPINTSSTTLFPAGCCNTGAGSSDLTFSVGATLELIQTGPIVSGTTLRAGPLGSWIWGSLTLLNFNLAQPITFIAPACTAAVSPITVVLPAVPTSALASGAGATAGSTPFNVVLNCPSGGTGNLQIQLTTTNPVGGDTGVITNTGSATGVGVQILQLVGSTFTAVTFGSNTQEGVTTLGGTLSIPYHAQYFRTTAALKSGTVAATATYTLTFN